MRDDGAREQKVTSKYEIRERADAFAVLGLDRCPVMVQAFPTYLALQLFDPNDPNRPLGRAVSFGFYDFHRLMDSIGNGLMAGWAAREDGRWGGARRWAVTQTKRAIAKRVHAQWQRLLTTIDPTVLAVHRAMFAAAFRTGRIAFEPELYRDRYIVRDILRYRAAAVAATYVNEGAIALLKRQVLALPAAAALREKAKAFGADLDIDVRVRKGYLYPAQEVNALHNWVGLFSPTGKGYRSLNRTLMNLPGGVSGRRLTCLAAVQLDHPVVDRLELTTICCAASLEDANSPRNRVTNQCVFLGARRGQVAEAMRRVAAHTHDDLSPTRSDDVATVVQFLADYPDPHRGNIVGLADKAIAWHRDQQAQAVEATASLLGADTATSLPPIPLPDVPGVRFLTTVGEVCEEGVRMDHCIATYADQAVNGECYLFHAERDGEWASVEVSPRGKVVQSQGPKNRRNGTSRWAAGVLNRWGRQFRMAPVGPDADDGGEDGPSVPEVAW